MTRDDTVKMLAIIKAAYPNFYKDMPKAELNAIVDVWASMFTAESGQVVVEAVRSLICTLKFPPTIADDEQVGKYIRLLCLQHQQGRLTEKHMLSICKAYDEDVFCKFKIDADGLYYNERMEKEAKVYEIAAWD